MNSTAHREKARLWLWTAAALIALLACPARAAADEPVSAPSPARVEAASPAESQAGTSKLITNMWVDTEVREVLQDISAQVGVTIIADQSVQAAVSMAVKQMPVEECLERLCAAGGYSFARVKDYYIVGRAEPGTAIFRRLADLHRVKLQHASTDQAKLLMPSALARYVTYDKTNGVILVSAPKAMRQRILHAIDLIDSPSKQVAVEVIVFELTEEGSKQLGLDWQYSRDHDYGADSQDRTTALGLGVDNLLGTITYDVADDISTYVDIALRAIVQDQKGRVLANPRIIAMNGKKAEIFMGQEKYFSLLSGQASNPYYRLESIKTGVTLTVTPHIGRDGQIVLDLAPDISDVASDWSNDGAERTEENGTASLPVVTRRSATTSVAIKDGQTIIIGGLLRERHRAMIEKVPVLGDIPGLRPFFRKLRFQKEQQEVVILITTYLMGDSDSDQVASGLQQRYVSPLDAISVDAGGGR